MFEECWDKLEGAGFRLFRERIRVLPSFVDRSGDPGKKISISTMVNDFISNIMKKKPSDDKTFHGPRHLNNEAGDWSEVLAQDLQ